MSTRIPKRISTALLGSLGAGVVPRIGLEYIAVGRSEEIGALLRDLENVSEGGAAFRFIVGRYGSGKSFLLQLVRNYAMDRGFVVADADLSPERRLSGTNRQGVGTYRELLKNLATKTRPDGGALPAILEKWISGIQADVLQKQGLWPADVGFTEAVEAKIMTVINNMEGLVHGFDFATVLSSYWRGHRLGDESLKEAALRWLRGEFATRSDARAALGVRVIVDDDSWYDYIKLLARFVADLGYRGLLLLVDEAVNLYKISHSLSRQANYEKLLTMFNDTMQGKAEHLGIFIGGTPKFVEDQRRGLFSYEALRSRLSESRFIKGGLRDTTGPILRLDVLSPEEVFVLLQRLAEVHALHHVYDIGLTTHDLQNFMQAAASHLGAEQLLTPREVIRDFLAVLNIMLQNPGISMSDLLKSVDFKPDKNADEDDRLAEFVL